MADMQTYGHNDIQRYLQHEMSPQEMHDFEKALMNDPFLADAMEGFSATDAMVTERHLSEIENELIGEKQKTKVVAMPLQKKAWWKVAAVVLVVVTGGVLTYSLLTKSGAEKNVAQQMAPSRAEMALTTDSIGPADPLTKVEKLPEKELLNKNKTSSPIIREGKGVPMAARQPTATESKAVGYDTIKTAGSSGFMDRNADVASALKAPAALDNAEKETEAQSRTLAQALPEYEFKGRVVDTNNLPLSGATISVPERNIGTAPDPKGNFTLKAKDSVLKINVNAIGYASKDLTIKNNAPVDIVLEESQGLTSEVVVTGLSLKKKRKLNARRLKENTANVAEPEGGWENFEQYLSQQIDSLKTAADDNQYNDNIDLEFTIDEQGHPANIKVPEKADSLTAEKAVQILMNGPIWKSKKKDKKVKVTIRFE